LKQHNERELAVEVERTQEDLKNLSMQEEHMSTQDLARKELLSLTPLKEHQQYKATRLRESKNKYGKRNPETQIIGKKERKLSKETNCCDSLALLVASNKV
jgi:hypothetical protein